MLKRYYALTKPGIVYGNAMTTLAAFLFASEWHFSLLLFFTTMIGIMLVIASACVFNNYFDRGIDRTMARTKDRPLVTGVISPRAAIAFGSILFIVGSFLLVQYVNILTAFVALIGFIFYIPLYTFSKRVSSWGTIVGSVSGAAPIVVGYTAATNKFDLAALTLFVIMVLWQMPHFYAIAIRRLNEYQAAGIPVLPAKRGVLRTKLSILLYIMAYLVAVYCFALFGFAGKVYLFIVLFFGILWLLFAMQGFGKVNDIKWARNVFLCSLVVLLTFCLALALSPLLP